MFSECPFGKHAKLSFKYTELLSLKIGHLIVSDICGPFDPSFGGYRYLITWLDTMIPEVVMLLSIF